MAGVGSKKTQFKDQGLGVGDRKPLSFQIPDPYDQILRSLPNRSAKIREWVIAGMLQEGLAQQD
ncbi:hypothetical protein [Iningainema tapete]|uniref:Uncharacterized protein n=1 Tax=Iningainema tapete BLCC-T55 TaxID=2748662 RepID=A0A8J6XK64_9CYAN|nr:hypothetical protein [Iningainema tapete]MBD2771892.1 hypothetical protein [Iningainema tapete BLCC-T55]